MQIRKLKISRVMIDAKIEDAVLEMLVTDDSTLGPEVMQISPLLPTPADQNLSCSRQEMLKDQRKQMRDTAQFRMALKYAPSF